MKEPPLRSRATDLTDDELLLCDLVFDCATHSRSFEQEIYSFHLNCPYSHALGPDALVDRLNDLVRLGIMRKLGSRYGNTGPRYTLSEYGGHLWEVERCPDWTRYVSTLYLEDSRNGYQQFVAASPNVDAARQCIGVLFAAGNITPLGRMRIRVRQSLRLLAWRVFPRCYRVSVPIRDHFSAMFVPNDWDFCSAYRTWWRDLSELSSCVATMPRQPMYPVKTTPWIS